MTKAELRKSIIEKFVIAAALAAFLALVTFWQNYQSGKEQYIRLNSTAVLSYYNTTFSDLVESLQLSGDAISLNARAVKGDEEAIETILTNRPTIAAAKSAFSGDDVLADAVAECAERHETINIAQYDGLSPEDKLTLGNALTECIGALVPLYGEYVEATAGRIYDELDEYSFVDVIKRPDFITVAALAIIMIGFVYGIYRRAA